MVETHWDDIRGRSLRYDDHSWELTGDVAVRNRGELVVVEARQTDGSKHHRAALHFDTATAGESLNPGNLGDYIHQLEPGDDHALVVKTNGRRYRYVLNRIEYR